MAEAARNAPRLPRPLWRPTHDGPRELYDRCSFRIMQRAPRDNTCRCRGQKIASQWFRRVLSRRVVYRYTGIKCFRHGQLGLREAHSDQGMPARTIARHLHANHATDAAIPRPDSLKAFCTLRETHDIVPSWYSSSRFSRAPVYPASGLRRNLDQLDMRGAATSSMPVMELAFSMPRESG